MDVVLAAHTKILFWKLIWSSLKLFFFFPIELFIIEWVGLTDSLCFLRSKQSLLHSYKYSHNLSRWSFLPPPPPIVKHKIRHSQSYVRFWSFILTCQNRCSLFLSDMDSIFGMIFFLEPTRSFHLCLFVVCGYTCGTIFFLISIGQ